MEDGIRCAKFFMYTVFHLPTHLKSKYNVYSFPVAIRKSLQPCALSHIFAHIFISMYCSTMYIYGFFLHSIGNKIGYFLCKKKSLNRKKSVYMQRTRALRICEPIAIRTRQQERFSTRTQK